MKSMFVTWSRYISIACMLVSCSSDAAPIRLANDPSLSPDGSTVAFSWNGEIWTVPVTGGNATPLTRHAAKDREPVFSPDGKEIAFTSDRDGSSQLYVMSASGGVATQLTYHTAGCALEGWAPDGNSLIISGARDHNWKHADRFFRVSRTERSAESILFDDYGRSASLSPDGKKLLFVREGSQWWRKGYRGAQASQIWQYDLETRDFTKVLARDTSCSSPLWRPDGKAFYFVSFTRGYGELSEFDWETKAERRLTQFDDDTVTMPCLSRDGSTIVFRHLFDLYRLNVRAPGLPEKIDIHNVVDHASERIHRRVLASATDVAFSNDGLELAFIAGGDLWVMDTELREPVLVVSSVEEEREPVVSPDGDAIFFVSERDGQCDIWRAERGDASKYWWQQANFKVEPVTRDADTESGLKLSSDGTRLAFVKGQGDLWILDLKSKEPRRLVRSWNAPDFDWSPDGRWIAFAKSDDDFNRDIWIVPSDGSRDPVNISRHPNNDSTPVWSPDGKILAFVGRRYENEVDIFYAWLQEVDEQTNRHDRDVKKAIEKLEKSRKKSATKTTSTSTGKGKVEISSDEEPTTANAAEPTAGRSALRKPTPAKVDIDLENIHDRLHRISIPASQEGGLFWSADFKKLAFSASIDGKRGTYTVEFPDNLRPNLLIAQTGTKAKWSTSGNITWLSGGAPGTVSSSGQANSYRFRARQEIDVERKNVAAFEQAWRKMRDGYYDERLGNKNWDAIRRKYSGMAAEAVDVETLATVINMMLGELNGSHLGFSPFGGGAGAGRGANPQPDPPPSVTQQPVPPEPEPPAPPTSSGSWRNSTRHLGLRFDPNFKGPGLRVRDVIMNGPASRKASLVSAGETVVSINGTSVDPAMDLTKVLNLSDDDNVDLVVKNEKGEDRHVTLRTISYATARSLLYDMFVRDNRKRVSELSNGSLGYLHISGMNMPSFHKFEQELYSVGYGKNGLVIDVRENPGGSITDHLLTALSQPTHATTVPRGGGPGYPQDRVVYTVWDKPIVVLCNQNSFSNAEIFSHAIKTLKRGKLVGVPTAGGVISTGATVVMDVGTLRMPFRGWYLRDTGEDMELNGAVPDVVIWPEPGDTAKGRDVQLDKAVEVLLVDVKTWSETPRPRLKKASER